MFGYVIADRQQMSDEDIRKYKAYYCGLCKELRQIAGLRGSVVLSYDVTFLYILLSGLYEPDTITTIERCRIHPLHRHTIFTNSITNYVASMNILLGYYNLCDDYHDDNNVRKKQLADYLEKYLGPIKSRYPSQASTCAEMIDLISEAEKRHEENIDIPAGYTGQMLAEVFAMKDDNWQNDLRNIGFYVGKFVYILDAYLDIDKDRKSGCYNPLITRKDNDSDGFEDYIEVSLTSLISEAARAFERLPVLRDASIVRNILYSGVWSAFRVHKHRITKSSPEPESEEENIGSIQNTRRTI